MEEIESKREVNASREKISAVKGTFSLIFYVALTP
jgi:hypothetical protein